MEAGVVVEFGVEGYAELVALAGGDDAAIDLCQGLGVAVDLDDAGARINVSGTSPSMPSTCPLVRKLPSCLP